MRDIDKVTVPSRDQKGTQCAPALFCGCPRNCKQRAFRHDATGANSGKAVGALSCKPGDLPSTVVIAESLVGVCQWGFSLRTMQAEALSRSDVPHAGDATLQRLKGLLCLKQRGHLAYVARIQYLY